MRKINRKYSVYQAMGKALKGHEFLQPFALGTFLLDKFLDGDRTITEKEAIDNDFIVKKRKDDKAFSIWRSLLVENNWLIYDHEQAVARKTIGLCKPGKRLTAYLNKEKIQNKELVTTDMLEKRTAKVDVLQELVKVLIDKIDPPYTEEKEEAYLADSEAFYDAIEMKILENGSRRNTKQSSEIPDYSKALKN